MEFSISVGDLMLPPPHILPSFPPPDSSHSPPPTHSSSPNTDIIRQTKLPVGAFLFCLYSKKWVSAPVTNQGMGEHFFQRTHICCRKPSPIYHYISSRDLFLSTTTTLDWGTLYILRRINHTTAFDIIRLVLNPGVWGVTDELTSAFSYLGPKPRSDFFPRLWIHTQTLTLPPPCGSPHLWPTLLR